jgi:hypothetical protein
MTLYINQGEILNYRMDDAGVMTCKGIARSPGPLTYIRSDGSKWTEFVSPEFIRGIDESTGMPYVAALAGQKISSEHPPALFSTLGDRALDLKNDQGKIVGRSHNKVHVYRDGKVEVTFDVFDSAEQEAIRKGEKRGLSVGYRCGTKQDAGEWNGIRYDAVQVPPWEVDHIALCRNPRNSDALITKFDSVDDVAVQVIEPGKSGLFDSLLAVEEGKQDAEQLYQIEVNGRPFMVPLDLYLAIKAEDDDENEEYEDSDMRYSGIFDSEDEELLKEILMDAKAKKYMPKVEDEDMEDEEEMDEEEDMEDEKPAFLKFKKDSWMRDRIDSLESELDALRAKCDAQNKLLAKFDSIDLDELVSKKVDAILETYNKLRPYLPEDFKLDGNASVERMKLDAIREMDPDADVSDETPEAVLDSVLAVLTRYHRKDSTEQQARSLNTPAKTDARSAALEAVNNFYANAWKGGRD